MNRRPAPTPDPDAPEVLILSVRLASGQFESELRLPLLGVTQAKKEEAMGQWLDLIQTGFRIGATEIAATLAPIETAGKDQP